MIIAGIDEAGLGPKLGPLVVSATGFWLDDKAFDIENISLWEVFSTFTSNKKLRNDTRLLVADSKIAYKAKGITGLKETVLNFCRALDPEKEITTLYDLLTTLGAETQISDISQSKWFNKALSTQSADNRFSLEDNAIKEIKATGVKPLLLRTKILTASMLNKSFGTGLNKSEVLLTQTGSHIKHLVNSFPDEIIKITVDKQGGKTYYAPYLIDLLDGAWVETIREGANSSLYKVKNNVYIEFLPKADKNNFTVALASIISKFIRETLMDEFNNYFISRISSLHPTAGYPLDAKRFIDEIEKTLISEDIEKQTIWRER